MSRAKQHASYHCPVCGILSRHRYCRQHDPRGWQTEHRDKYADKPKMTEHREVDA